MSKIEPYFMFVVINKDNKVYHLLACTKYHAVSQAVMLDESKYPTASYKVCKKIL